MSSPFRATEIVKLQENCIIQWKQGDIILHHTHFFRLVEENHAFNFKLWHEEDKARRDDLGFEHVYLAKRKIDGYNQQRNNCMEAMDIWLHNSLKPSASENCPIHSETPGMMIDRLSILALKAYHMQVQMNRQDVDDTHRQQCENRWLIICKQQAQLQDCLQKYLEEIVAGTRTFRVYHQFKMYNDPKLNPELYLEKTPSQN